MRRCCLLLFACWLVACANGNDSGGGPAPDAGDPASGADAAPDNAETACQNAEDDDGDGLPDCTDPDCDNEPRCATGAESCTNSFDDDGDGFRDCRDPDCDGVWVCELGTERSCDDDADNDGDLMVDCDDDDCVADPACAPESVCDDDVDNDGDGMADCLDPDCDGVAMCQSGRELACGDGFDNDGDGDSDCADADCAGAVACVTMCPAGSTSMTLSGSGLPLTIPDAASTSTTLTGASGTVTRLAVAVDVAHTYIGDVRLALESPAGTEVLLFDGHGSSDDNMTATVFTDAATLPIASGTAPFTGSFRPDESLDALIGETGDGTWTLHASDTDSGVTGTLEGLDLVLCLCTDCEVGAACTDGIDNDGDGATDCDDSDCAGVVQCAAEVCDDGVDNDADGAIDCYDAECAAFAACVPEADCHDGVDDDGDSAIDCQDPGCFRDPTCEPGGETSCGDGVDNDSDGDADCDDSECAATILCAHPCPTGSTTVVLDPADVPQSIPDPGAVTSTVDAGAGTVLRAAVAVDVTHGYTGDVLLRLASPVGTEVVLFDRHGSSGDNLTGTIFLDQAATAVASASPPYTGAFQPDAALAGVMGEDATGTWTLRASDEGGGVAGTLDDWQLVLCTCTDCEVGAACLDGNDNDGDSLVDCADPDCAAVAQCIPEAVCDDGADDDLDGAIDCQDADCDGVAGCEYGAEVSCTDEADNDGDAAVDCDDSDCAADVYCAAETDCHDGSDDDGDGAMDCQDPGCAADPTCEPAGEVSCGDGIDNDSDGDADCDDSECANVLACVASCPSGSTAQWLSPGDVPMALPDLGAAVSTVTATAGTVVHVAVSTDVSHAYIGDVAVSLAAPGGAEVTLFSRHGGSGDDLDGTVFTDDAGTPIASGTPPYAGSFQPAEPLADLTGEAAAGTWTLRAADESSGVAGTLEDWQLLVCTCTDCEVGTALCSDGIDNDSDGDIDCDDAECAGLPACMAADESLCDDGVDNDGDGLTDCDEPACALACSVDPCPGGTRAVGGTGYGLPLATVDNGAVESTVWLTGAGTVTRAIVSLSVTHTYDGDLDISLVSPAGTSLDLSSDNGGGSDNYIDTVFADTAMTDITAGSAPFTGTFRPETPLATVNGESITGGWVLQVADDAGGDGGSFTAYDLALCVAP